VSKATAAHAAALQITLIHLPAYSPNLNLIERAWKVMNEQVRNDVYFPDAKTFINAIKNFFTKSWNKISESLRPRFSEPGSGLNTVRLGNFM
jgi:transposase